MDEYELSKLVMTNLEWKPGDWPMDAAHDYATQKVHDLCKAFPPLFFVRMALVRYLRQAYIDGANSKQAKESE